jgi:signal transduction histidine kinase
VKVDPKVEGRVDWKARSESLQEELADLIQAVSHDLRAPLRAAEAFSRLVLTRHTEGLPEQARDYLQRIRAAASEMSAEVEAVSRLARVIAVELRPEPIDLAALAGEVLSELRESEPGREVEVQVERGPEVIGDRALLRTLLAVLLDNAWRFTRERPGARIELVTERQEGATAHRVRDNGAGFDMADARHLFAPFTRLHERRDAAPAVGLAIARRVVHRHGGRIWAEAVPGEGATFSFTLGEGPLC